jgi:imidazolonepropionase-like amidohydrolase
MRTNRWLSVFAFLLLWVGPSWTQVPSAKAQKTVVIRAGRLLDVKTGKTLANQTIVIEGDKIASIVTKAELPAGATVIDLPNATVLPGLIDAHTHVTFNPSLDIRS